MTRPKTAIPIINRNAAAAMAGISVAMMAKLDKADAYPAPYNGVGYPAAIFARWLFARWERERGIAPDEGGPVLEKEKARLTKAQADKAEIDAAERRGSMVSADQVITRWSSMAGSLRARLLGVHAKIAPRVRAASSDEEAATLIELAIIEALEEIADDGLPSSARPDRASDSRDASPAAEDDGIGMGGSVSPPVTRKRGRARKVGD